MMTGGPDAALRLILFDCDGTLVDSAHIIVDTVTAAWEAEGLTPPPADIVRRQIGLPVPQAVANLYPDAPAALLQRLDARFREIFVAGRQAGAHEDPLYEGCASVLAELAGRAEVLLGVATGKGRRGLIHTLEKHGIAQHFQVLKTADDGPGKPDPKILHDEMAEMGVTPWQTVMIGDTVFDMTMAANAGVRAIGVSWGYHTPDDLLHAGAGAVADTFGELPRLIGRLWD